MDETQAALGAAERYVTAWLGDDLETILDYYADDMTLHYFGDNPHTGDYVGKAATLLETGAKAPRKLLAVDHIMAGPGCATIVARELLRFGDTDTEIT